MRLHRFGVPAFSAALASVMAGDARAFTASIVEDQIRTLAYSRPGAMPPYGTALHQEILKEIQRTSLPFRLIAPVRLVVLFAVDRRGQLAHLSISQKSHSKIIDDYVEAMVRGASRRFPAPTADLPGDFQAFDLPIRLEKTMPDGG